MCSGGGGGGRRRGREERGEAVAVPVTGLAPHSPAAAPRLACRGRRGWGRGRPARAIHLRCTTPGRTSKPCRAPTRTPGRTLGTAPATYQSIHQAVHLSRAVHPPYTGCCTRPPTTPSIGPSSHTPGQHPPVHLFINNKTVLHTTIENSVL